VIVVNDSSTDGTEELLAELSVTYKHLRYTSIPVNEKFLHGKKLALTIGLKAARHDHVVLTDADCYPLSDQWLQIMPPTSRGRRRLCWVMEDMSGRKGS
jgi:biofilm PGA synthesis N-glycosyltransferase PgaC